MNDGYSYWSMHDGDYLKESCKMVHKWSNEDGRIWNKNREVAMIGTYRLEINISDKLGDELATKFQQMIGILRWLVELG